MPRYLVSGDIICGAFAHVIDAVDAEHAEELTRILPLYELDTTSSEHPYQRIDTIILDEEEK